MSCRKGALVLLTLAVLAVAVLAPSPSDADTAVNKAECGGVTMIVFADNVKMNTLESCPVSVHLYNSNASPVWRRRPKIFASKRPTPPRASSPVSIR